MFTIISHDVALRFTITISKSIIFKMVIYLINIFIAYSFFFGDYGVFVDIRNKLLSGLLQYRSKLIRQVYCKFVSF